MKNEKDLLLRCYVKQEKTYWVAVCIDLCLAAQAESQEDAQKKLEAMISTYIADAFGKHKIYAKQLLSRKAPLSQRAFYYRVLFLEYLRLFFRQTNTGNAKERVFSEHYPIGAW